MCDPFKIFSSNSVIPEVACITRKPIEKLKQNLETTECVMSLVEVAHHRKKYAVRNNKMAETTVLKLPHPSQSGF